MHPWTNRWLGWLLVLRLSTGGWALQQQTGILVEYRLMKIGQFGAGFDPELIYQPSANRPKCLQRVRLPAGAV
jgi:hypothetical protein